jgi:hypothetical protein
MIGENDERMQRVAPFLREHINPIDLLENLGTKIESIKNGGGELRGAGCCHGCNEHTPADRRPGGGTFGARINGARVELSRAKTVPVKACGGEFHARTFF